MRIPTTLLTLLLALALHLPTAHAGGLLPGKLQVNSWRADTTLDWVHGERVVGNKVARWSVGGQLEIGLGRGPYLTGGATLYGLNVWEKNPRNGWDAVTHVDLQNVDSTEPVYAYGAGFDFGRAGGLPCRAEMVHTTYPTFAVPDGRYNTVTRFTCGREY